MNGILRANGLGRVWNLFPKVIIYPNGNGKPGVIQDFSTFEVFNLTVLRNPPQFTELTEITRALSATEVGSSLNLALGNNRKFLGSENFFASVYGFAFTDHKNPRVLYIPRKREIAVQERDTSFILSRLENGRLGYSPLQILRETEHDSPAIVDRE